MSAQVYPFAGSPAMSYVPQQNYDKQKMNGAAVGPIPPPATYRPPIHRQKPGCCRLFCSLLFCFFVTILALFGITILVMWLVLRPHVPSYSLQNIEFHSFNLTEQQNAYSLNSDILYTLEARNPNKRIGIQYDEIDIHTFYAGDELGQSSIPAFYQGHRNTTILTSELKLVNATLSRSAGTILQSSIQSTTLVSLQIRVDVRARMKFGSYTSFHFWVHSNCDVQFYPPTATTPASVTRKSCGHTR
jgi:hypothetical protein